MFGRSSCAAVAVVNLGRRVDTVLQRAADLAQCYWTVEAFSCDWTIDALALLSSSTLRGQSCPVGPGTVGRNFLLFYC